MHIILFSPIPYTHLHQRPQKLADRLVASGDVVTFVEPSAWRAYRGGPLTGFLAAVARGVWYYLCAAWIPGRGHARIDSPQHPELRRRPIPLGIPINRTGSAVLNAWIRRVYRAFLEREVLPSGERATAVALVEEPYWGGIVRSDDVRALCYDCIDDVSVYVGRNTRKRYAECERELINAASSIFVTSAVLEADLRSRIRDRRIVRLPNGVDAREFAARAADPLPEALSRIPRPRAGYVGYLGPWLDYQLLDTVVRDLNDVQFVFAGPVDDAAGFRKLSAHANFHWIGVLPHTAVPSVVQALDCCLIPFANGPIARSTNPLKLYEYFSLGKPVVTTPLTELEPFRAGELVYWAQSPDEFVKGIRASFTETDQKRIAARRAVAEQNTWDTRVDVLRGVFGGRD